MPSQAYTASIKTDSKAQTRTNERSGRGEQTSQRLPTSAATANQGKDTDSTAVDETISAGQQRDAVWLGNQMNTSPSRKYTGNDVTTLSFESGQRAVNSQSQMISNDRRQEYDTNGPVSINRFSTEGQENETASQVDGAAQVEPATETSQDERAKDTLSHGIQGFVTGNGMPTESERTDWNESPGMKYNETPNGPSTSRSTLTEQTYPPTTKLSSTGANTRTNNMYQELPSKSMYAEVSSGDRQGTSKNIETAGSSSSAQRRGEEARPSNITVNETAKVGEQQQPGNDMNSQSTGDQNVTAITSDLSSKALPTSRQQASNTQKYVPTSKQELSTVQNQQATLSNNYESQQPSQATGDNVQLMTTMAALVVNSTTTETTPGSTKMPSLSTGNPTSKVIAEMKTTDRGNASDVETINPVTGSVILTERVSYKDLNNETDEAEEYLKKKADALPQGPSILFAPEYNYYFNGLGSPGQQRSAVGNERPIESPPAALETEINASPGGELSRFESQGSRGQSSEVEKSTVDRSEAQSTLMDSSVEDQGSQQTSSVTEANDNANEGTAQSTNGGYPQQVSFEHTSPSVKAQIPNNAETQSMADTAQAERRTSDGNSAQWMNTGNVEQAERDDEQNDEDSRVRMIRTLPATLVPPLTSPLIDDKGNEGETATTGTQPTKKAGKDTTEPTSKSETTSQPVTGDIMALNDKLGIEQVESGDYLDAPPEVAAQHVYTPRTPDPSAKGDAGNYTIHKIFNEIVGNDVFGHNEGESVTSDDAKKEEYGNQDVEDSKEDKTDDKADDLKIQNDEDKEKGDQSIDSTIDNHDGKTDAVTSETENENARSSSQYKESTNQLTESSNQNTESSNQKVTVIEQGGNDTESSSESTDQSLKNLDKGSISVKETSLQSEKESSLSSGARDESADKEVKEGNYTVISQDSKSNALKLDKDTLENPSQRDEILDNEQYKEPNAVDGDDEFELPILSTDLVNESLEDLLLHPDSLPPETVADEVRDEGENLIEANDMVVHDDLDR